MKKKDVEDEGNNSEREDEVLEISESDEEEQEDGDNAKQTQSRKRALQHVSTLNVAELCSHGWLKSLEKTGKGSDFSSRENVSGAFSWELQGQYPEGVSLVEEQGKHYGEYGVP